MSVRVVPSAARQKTRTSRPISIQWDYDAVELALDKRLSNHWSARASYTWSRLYGNYSGLVGSDWEQPRPRGRSAWG